MLYFLGVFRSEAGTSDAKEISSMLSVISERVRKRVESQTCKTKGGRGAYRLRFSIKFFYCISLSPCHRLQPMGHISR
jgi:hypothetical protein